MQLSDRMLNVLKNENQLYDMSRTNIKKAKLFHEDIIVTKWLEYIRKICDL